MSGLWFRIYDEALDDPRLQRLPASLFRAWFNVLCATSRNGGTLPDLPELAFMLRTRPGALSRRIEALKAAGLLEETDGALRPVEWEKQQFVERAADPTAAERMRRFRERAAERNGAVTPTVTNVSIEKDEDLDQDSQTAPAARESAIDAFEEFLRVFPRRDGDHPRAPTLAAWRRAIAACADPARIIAGAKDYAASGCRSSVSSSVTCKPQLPSVTLISTPTRHVAPPTPSVRLLQRRWMAAKATTSRLRGREDSVEMVGAYGGSTRRTASQHAEQINKILGRGSRRPS